MFIAVMAIDSPSVISEGARFGLCACLLVARFLAPKRLIIQVRRIVLSACSRRSNVSRGGPRERAGKERVRLA